MLKEKAPGGHVLFKIFLHDLPARREILLEVTGEHSIILQMFVVNVVNVMTVLHYVAAEAQLWQLKQLATRCSNFAVQ